MKKQSFSTVFILCLILLFSSSCLPSGESGNKGAESAIELTLLPRVRGNEWVNRDLYALPEALYESEAAHGGTLREEEYETKDYLTGEGALKKKCQVYTPYGYDESEKYEILYLMHGHMSDIYTLMGWGKFKNLLDNMIERKMIEPVVIVTPTFAPHNEKDTLDADTAYEWVKVFHREFGHDLMPFVEGKYHTYSDYKTDEESLKNSKAHRAFAGFSLGALTTWYQLYENSEYIYRFGAMALDFWTGEPWVSSDESEAKNNASVMTAQLKKRGVTQDDFVVEAFSGTADSLYLGMNNYMKYIFSSGGPFTENNTHYGVIPYGAHDFPEARTYFFNTLLLFYGSE